MKVENKLVDFAVWVGEKNTFHVLYLTGITTILLWDVLYTGFRGFYEWRLGVMAIIGLNFLSVCAWANYFIRRWWEK